MLLKLGITNFHNWPALVATVSTKHPKRADEVRLRKRSSVLPAPVDKFLGPMWYSRNCVSNNRSAVRTAVHDRAAMNKVTMYGALSLVRKSFANERPRSTLVAVVSCGTAIVTVTTHARKVSGGAIHP